jgi:hypothetical protein
MISVVILLVREQTTWHIRRCAVNLGDRIRACPCPTRVFSSQDAATEAMKRRVMQHLWQKGYTDSPLDIDWHIKGLAPPHDPVDRTRL